MKEFHIRNIPDDLHKALRQEALDIGDTIRGTLITILTKELKHHLDKNKDVPKAKKRKKIE